MRCNCATSASRGTLSRISVSSVNKPAIISGNAAFFAPEMAMVPLSLLPPTIRMRSILKIPCYAKTIESERSWQKPDYLRLFDGPRHSGAREARTSDVQLHIGEVRDHTSSNFRVQSCGLPRNDGKKLKRIDVLALQDRFRIAIARHADHGAAEFFAGGHELRLG